MIGLIRKSAADDFEQKLAQMADAEISQNMPSLSRYKVGFQLARKNDDNTRGMGVSVYKMGEEWLFIPAFFLNGRLRGYDLMYLPLKSQFVPAKDNWVAYLNSNKVAIMGEPSERTGNTKPKGPGAARLYDKHLLARISKISSELENSDTLVQEEHLKDMLRLAGRPDENELDLRRWIPRLGKVACQIFLNTLNKDADFANAVLRFYSPEDIGGIVDGSLHKTAADPLKVETSLSNVQIITRDSDKKDIQKLDEKSKEVLMRDGMFVIDNRPETTVVFQPKDAAGVLTTPNKNGFYELLQSDGSFKKFYVIYCGIDVGNPVGPSGTRGKASGEKNANISPRGVPTEVKYRLIDLSQPDRAFHVNTEILGRLQPDRAQNDISGLGIKAPSLVKEIAKLKEDPNGLSPKALEGSDTYDDKRWILIDTKGNTVSLRIQESAQVLGKRITDAVFTRREESMYWCDQIPGTVEFTNYNGALTIKNNKLYVPATARAIRLSHKCAGPGNQRPVFGTIDTVRDYLTKTSGLEALDVVTDGVEYKIISRFGKKRGLTKQAAVQSLVLDHGIGVADAKQMLPVSVNAADRRAMKTFMVKYAASSVVTTDSVDGLLSPVVGYNTAPDELEVDQFREVNIPKEDAQAAITASERGVKDVVDISILKSLANSSSPGRVVNDYIGDMLLALDRVGRILFMFYWHYDSFKERYGVEKMIELEESLRSNFQNLSDLVLFLHKSNSDSQRSLFSDKLSGEMG